MRELSSLQNPVVKAARALGDRRARREQNAFLLDGEHMVSEALAARPADVHTVFIDPSRGFDALAQKAESAGAEVFAVPAHVLEALSQVKTSQGIAAVCALPAPVSADALGERLLLLEDVQDPGNVGTILRTLDAAGFDGCLMTQACADPYSPKVLRATMGSVFRVPIAFIEDAPTAVEALNARGYATLAAALDGEPFEQRGALKSRVCVLIGNEGAGLRRDTIERCTHRYKLPMRGGAESLNAAVAASVFMYDLIMHEKS